MRGEAASKVPGLSVACKCAHESQEVRAAATPCLDCSCDDPSPTGRWVAGQFFFFGNAVSVAVFAPGQRSVANATWVAYGDINEKLA